MSASRRIYLHLCLSKFEEVFFEARMEIWSCVLLQKHLLGMLCIQGGCRPRRLYHSPAVEETSGWGDGDLELWVSSGPSLRKSPVLIPHPPTFLK